MKREENRVFFNRVISLGSYYHHIRFDILLDVEPHLLIPGPYFFKPLGLLNSIESFIFQ